tara:strand:+ start:287 stop:808 length:522 start_codon:yes stop_codon:yes gene_type:complete
MDHQNNHERFTRLLLEAEPVMLRSVLVVVPNRTDARDILQETAVALWRQFDSYDPQRPFVNWAMGFSRIETRRFLTRQKRRAQLSEQAMELLERELEGDTSFAVEVERHLATCMQKLGEKQHALIQGYYHENRSVEWLAEQGGRSVEAVYKAIQRTRIDLQTCIQRQIRKEII